MGVYLSRPKTVKESEFGGNLLCNNDESTINGSLLSSVGGTPSGVVVESSQQPTDLSSNTKSSSPSNNFLLTAPPPPHKPLLTRFGMTAMQGWRQSMEDSHVAVPSFQFRPSLDALLLGGGVGGEEEKGGKSSTTATTAEQLPADGVSSSTTSTLVPPPMSVYGVFDGHGGTSVSKWVAKHFTNVLSVEISKLLKCQVIRKDIKLVKTTRQENNNMLLEETEIVKDNKQTTTVDEGGGGEDDGATNQWSGVLSLALRNTFLVLDELMQLPSSCHELKMYHMEAKDIEEQDRREEKDRAEREKGGGGSQDDDGEGGSLDVAGGGGTQENLLKQLLLGMGMQFADSSGGETGGSGGKGRGGDGKSVLRMVEKDGQTFVQLVPTGGGGDDGDSSSSSSDGEDEEDKDFAADLENCDNRDVCGKVEGVDDNKHNKEEKEDSEVVVDIKAEESNDDKQKNKQLKKKENRKNKSETADIGDDEIVVTTSGGHRTANKIEEQTEVEKNSSTSSSSTRGSRTSAKKSSVAPPTGTSSSSLKAKTKNEGKGGAEDNNDAEYESFEEEEEEEDTDDDSEGISLEALTGAGRLGQDGGGGDAGSERLADDTRPTSPWSPVGVGATATVSLVAGWADKQVVITANVGDSRAVLCRANGIAYSLSKDHKPYSQEEARRIYRAGGSVVNGRVDGNLNLTRTLGDLMYKSDKTRSVEEQKITAFGDLRCTCLDDQDEFLLVGCDGIWDCLSNQAAVDFVRNAIALYLELQQREGGPISKDEFRKEVMEFDEVRKQRKDSSDIEAGDGGCGDGSTAAAATRSMTGMLVGRIPTEMLSVICECMCDSILATSPFDSEGIGCDNMTCIVVQLNTKANTEPRGEPPVSVETTSSSFLQTTVTASDTVTGVECVSTETVSTSDNSSAYVTSGGGRREQRVYVFRGGLVEGDENVLEWSLEEETEEERKKVIVWQPPVEAGGRGAGRGRSAGPNNPDGPLVMGDTDSSGDVETINGAGGNSSWYFDDDEQMVDEFSYQQQQPAAAAAVVGDEEMREGGGDDDESDEEDETVGDETVVKVLLSTGETKNENVGGEKGEADRIKEDGRNGGSER
eukprot:GHVS01005418.1.p1 GENE.GHVS01005418.1~~GHVS01005418.1.p1  ORF type:complete len:1091 (+),score=337.32 GHVS01005418.1:204-3476(+)